MRMLLEYRGAFNLAVAAVIGTLGQRAWPFPADNVFLAVIDTRQAWLFDGLAYLYATLWFSTPFVALSIVSALATIAVLRGERATSYTALPPYPDPATRQDLFLVLGEQQHGKQITLILTAGPALADDAVDCFVQNSAGALEAAD